MRIAPSRGFKGLKMLFLAMLLGLSGAAAAAETWQSEIWFDALFDEAGQLKQIEPVNEAEHPAAFWAQMKQRLQSARVPPRQQDGQPATFRTGIMLLLNVTKGSEGGSASIAGLQMRPIPIKRFAASLPKDIRAVGGWQGEVMASCTIDKIGACTNVKVHAPAGMPASLLRWAKVSAEGWQFKPTEINGQPIESEVAIPFDVRINDDMPVEFRYRGKG